LVTSVLISCPNSVLKKLDVYQTAIRPLLFSGLKADPEWLHQQTIRWLAWLDQVGDRAAGDWLHTQLQQSYGFADARLGQKIWGSPFANPVGLAAGFDKDGVASGMWTRLGFGFAELGTVTFHAQPGNPKPRLFRLPQDQAALNRMGFNNQGAAAMAERLKHRWQRIGAGSLAFGAELNPQNLALKTCPRSAPIGINLGKSKITPLEEAATDYLNSFRLLKPWGDYFVVNVSSPNTPGLRSLQATEQLEPILAVLQQENAGEKPLLIKIAPDLEWDEIAAIITLAQRYNLAGIIATNTTIQRDRLTTQTLAATGTLVHEEAGGISGAPLRQRSTDIIRFIYQSTQGQLPIIGVGGVFTTEHAWEKITAGASLLQVYTGWIYEGPWMVRRILQGLVQKLEDQGLEHLSEAVGIATGIRGAAGENKSFEL
jgi:dihydroorotate dehydrogenase